MINLDKGGGLNMNCRLLAIDFIIVVTAILIVIYNGYNV